MKTKEVNLCFFSIGLKFEWQINEPADRETSCLVEKLGGRDTVKTLEGNRV